VTFASSAVFIIATLTGLILPAALTAGPAAVIALGVTMIVTTWRRPRSFRMSG
jgi:uncharacterized membrane protein